MGEEKGVSTGLTPWRFFKTSQTTLEHVIAGAGYVSVPALAGQFEHFLHGVMLRANGVGIEVTVAVCFDGAEDPGAAVTRLAAEIAGPGGDHINFRIAHSFRELVPHNGRSSVGAGIHVGALALAIVAQDEAGLAAAGALVRIANHRVLDDFAADDGGGGAMISAELAAEAGIGHILVGQDEVDSVGVFGEVPALDGVGNDGLNLGVAAEGLTQRVIVVVVIRGSVLHSIRDVLIGIVAVGCIDLVLSRSAEMGEIVVDNALVVLGPVPVPNDVNRGCGLKHGSTIVVNQA